MYAAKYRIWRTEGLKECDGVIVGSDQTQEWILPWWWAHYRKTNTHPVTFVDFGLTEEKKQWCRDRGELIHLPVAHIFVAEQEEVAPHDIADWEKQFGPRVWQARTAWFKKPLACLQSPFRRSLWLDIDCEIRTSIAPLFEACDHPSGIAMAKDLVAPKLEYPTYNSGVVAFRRGLPLIEEWATQVFERNRTFGGDQEILSKLIAEKDLQISQIHGHWNWSRCCGPHDEANIFHWHGDNGRAVIRQQLNGGL